MSVIYLRHKRHGTKVAISDMEASADKAHGWEEFDPTIKAEEIKALDEVIDVPEVDESKEPEVIDVPEVKEVVERKVTNTLSLKKK